MKKRTSILGGAAAIAATFVASLELVKQGAVELRQGETFGPIYLRARNGVQETQE